MQSKNQANLRQENILKMLDNGASISVQEFQKLLNCSYATIRNDLAYLEERGMILRTHGGAVRTDVSPVIGLERREGAHPDAKRAIARIAFEHLIHPGMTIILDSGTTNAEIARAIAESDMELNVITHSAPAIQLLCRAQNVQLFAVGGRYNRNSDAFFDGDIRNYTANMHADLFFLGFNGILFDQGFVHAVFFEQETKKKYLSMAAQTVAVGDSSKLLQSGLWIAGTFHEVKELITDSHITGELRQKLEACGLDIITVDNEKVSE